MQSTVAIPPRLQKRPFYKGLPIPFATHVDQNGVPDFKVVDMVAHSVCCTELVCALCGDPLDYWVWYLGSQQHIDSERVFDPGMHEDCARYAAAVCPYIAFGKGYATFIKEREGVQELRPLEEMNQAAVPMFLFQGRKNAIRVQGKNLKTGTIVSVESVPRRDRESK